MAKNLVAANNVTVEKAPSDGSVLDAESRRTMQETITVSLIGFLGAVCVFLFVGIMFASQTGRKETFDQLKDLVNLILGPLTTLLSTVVGFYFGAKIARTAEDGVK